MLKTFTVLFVLGLALGLWLGFNPQAHERTVKNWDDVRTSFLTVKANISATMHTWAVSLNSNEQFGSQKMTVVWKQISSIFTTIWDGAHRIWTDITLQLRTKK